jgi:murein DD-endopeptidase MepM/ murein hydrolase activator NlpD
MDNFESKYIKYHGYKGAKDDSNTPNHFLNDAGNYFVIEKIAWHEPVDDPISTLYMQSGGGGKLGKHWGLFGTTRNGAAHAGLDLFATTGTDIFACVDGTVYNRRWHGGYGNTITIKVTDTDAFKQLKRDYTLQYSGDGEIKEGVSWSDDGDIFLFYAHLDSVNEYAFGDEVKCGDVLGTTGRSGVTAGTCAPHLHFEILCDYKMAKTKYRINPAFWVNYKGFAEQSDAEKKSQETEKDKGKTKEVNGAKKLVYANMTGFVK